jgi:hypothetical protein
LLPVFAGFGYCFAGITSSLAMGNTLDGIHETSLVGLKIKELGLLEQ